jgi:hypothetical protein
MRFCAYGLRVSSTLYAGGDSITTDSVPPPTVMEPPVVVGCIGGGGGDATKRPVLFSCEVAPPIV